MKEKYLTLKEAADLSGYSSDYIGQLIRQGKISGKKVYSNVSWIITEQSLNEYIGRMGEGLNITSKFVQGSVRIGRLISINLDSARVYRFFNYFSILTAFVLFLLFFYIFSTSFDNKIEQRALQSITLDSYSE